MIAFYVAAAAITLAVLASLVWPLLRPRVKPEVSQQSLNAAVYREQLATLERDLADNTLSREQYEAERDEIHLRIVDDEAAAAQSSGKAASTAWASPRAAWSIALVVPLAAAGLYGWLGSPAAVDADRAQAAQQDQIIRMVDTLAAKLKANPENPKGWAMLARSYKVLGRLDEAERAYARVGPMLEQDPDLLVSYADVLAARSDSLEGRPMELVRKALAINPNHIIGLMLVGTAEYRDGDYAGAAKTWQRLLAQLEPGSPDAQQVEANIADAREKAGMPPLVAVASVTQSPPPGAPDPAAMVARLAARLKANPDDPAGWARLARAYEVLGKRDEARQAMEQGQLAQARANTVSR